MVNLRFFVPGTAASKGRPRARLVTPPGKEPYVQIYTDGATRLWEDIVAAHVKNQVARLEAASVGLPLSGRILADLRFNLPRPTSLPKKVRYPVRSRTDLDNLEKSVFDALQKAGVIANDCLVTDQASRKRYAEHAHPVGVEIDLTGHA